MNLLEQALRRVAADMSARHAVWTLVGGFAVSSRAEPRFTRDVDIAVAVADDPGAENLVQSLSADGYRLLATVEQDAVDRLAAARLACPPGGTEAVVVDLLFASSGVEQEVADAAEVLEVVPGLRLPVATVGHLIALKLLSRDDEIRPQDAADLRALASVANALDIDVARSAVRLIEQRGYARGRHLEAALDALIG